jgi:hypothetical protein
MAANSLGKMIQQAQSNGLITGLADDLVTNGIAILQYADDTILLIQDVAHQAVNLKLLLYIFEAMSGLKINFEKSEVLMILEDDDKQNFYSELFNCQKGTWPIKYLGTPVCARRTSVSEMKFLGEKTKKKMSGWIGNSMSIGGRLVKIDACLSSTVVYQMSLRILHKTNLEQMDKPIRSFFWAGSADKRKYHFVKWKWICRPKQKGGLGVKDLFKFNISLMCKWWWKLEHSTGPWQDFMRAKYLRGKGVYYAKHRPGDSPLWSDMLQVRSIYLCGRRMRVGDGN